jgi:energy-coupling factor transporter ATP-binding protein EcfA2
MKATITFVGGNNFSGRTEYLKNISQDGIYLGEIPSDFLSGIMPSVQQEIKLNAKNKNWDSILSLMSQYGFDKKLNQNPFTLSGGEQVVLTLLTHIMLKPSVITIDHTLEQLSGDWRKALITIMEELGNNNISYYIADNRLDEYSFFDSSSFLELPVNEKPYDIIYQKPDFSKHIANQENKVVIELDAISFRYSYGSAWIFKDLSFKMESGKIYRLYGGNGSGKSTLSKIIYGGLKPYSGNILLDGVKYNSYKYPGKLASYSFQNPDYQFFERTIKKEVNPKESESEKINSLELFGLSNLSTLHSCELPFTIRKRIALASTICSKAPVLIFDEPTLGQDDEFMKQYAFFLQKLSASGKIIVLISHSEQFISYFPSIEVINLNSNQL